ncbi:glucosyl-3-phosphoglycerate synthase [Rhodococcus sp. IEGM 1408]|uniref:glucosyl-3-phosphoglycerate synthase n=1 Tax=Rhodococcus sp. IEGM 1408 TaxID=3082220 RepID=UPI002953D92F|nr:glucosyl-3-phosphoglycerate synthase [Rhodococcus sp. IEGM 1408]MDV7999769.1 glucosyl-3-phosphoglycerate synthase [Rhodococcus sp. IEGM 1408]
MTEIARTPLADRVDPVRDWSARRTYLAGDFRAGDLVAAKDGRRVSVVLPARNEESTVGVIVEALRAELVDRFPLIDELVVIDSHSTDATADVARAAGARVVAQGDILPALGDAPGKGEALWKSLAATDGDVVAFLDSDLRDFDPAFAIGLLGPLLTEPGVVFCKGAFERPLDDGRTILPAGGGRVTELVARPLLALHWPALAGFVQPLAGEYAGTREALESIPFAGAYGVDIGILVDLLESYGLDALAQVDLGRRTHRNSPDSALAVMAMHQHLAVLTRLRRHGRSPDARLPGDTLTLHQRDPVSGDFHAEAVLVSPGERPPMRDVRAGLDW